MALSKRKRGRKSSQTTEAKRKEDEDQNAKEKGEEKTAEVKEGNIDVNTKQSTDIDVNGKIEDMIDGKRDEVESVTKTPEGRENVVTNEKRTKELPEEQLEKMRKENTELKREIHKLRLAQNNEEETPIEGTKFSSIREQGLCSPCAAYLLRLQEQDSMEDRRNKGQRKSEVDGNEKVKKDGTQAGSASQVKSVQEMGANRIDDGGTWTVEGGRKIWRKREEEHGGWITVQGKKRRDTRTGEHGIRTFNRFSVLETEEERGKKKVRYLVAGDSRVKPLGKVFCQEEDKCVVKPGALVSDIDTCFEEELTRCDPEYIIVQVGVNNVGPRRSVQLINDYSALLRRLKEARKPVIITGILPRAAASREWYSRALSANASVERLCSSMGLHFVDLWEEFYGRWEFYLRDGLHLSEEGAKILGEAYHNVIQGN